MRNDFHRDRAVQSQVLRQKGVEHAQTIHSLIYVPEEVPVPERKTRPDGSVFDATTTKLVFTLRDQIDCEGVLIDEASMVSSELYDDLRTYCVPLVFVGDHGQLEPVGDDPGLMREPDYRLV